MIYINIERWLDDAATTDATTERRRQHILIMLRRYDY
jgi:hypothetical protein